MPRGVSGWSYDCTSVAVWSRKLSLTFTTRLTGNSELTLVPVLAMPPASLSKKRVLVVTERLRVVLPGEDVACVVQRLSRTGLQA